MEGEKTWKHSSGRAQLLVLEKVLIDGELPPPPERKGLGATPLRNSHPGVQLTQHPSLLVSGAQWVLHAPASSTHTVHVVERSCEKQPLVAHGVVDCWEEASMLFLI